MQKRMVNTSRKRPLLPDVERDENIVSTLTHWFDRTHRSLPFREAKNAYGTWVSEIMLQQTQVKTVIPYFERWMKEFPTVKALANAKESAVLNVWQGLGYYSRARNLHRAAKVIVDNHDSQIPSDPQELLKLPGIGRYTAGAIASIAYDIPEPVVDGNVIRVLSRLDALRGDPRKKPLSEMLWSRAKALVELSDPSRFNQGLMELGALVCTPKNPNCSQCPLLKSCRAFPLGFVDTLPELPKRAKAVPRQVVVLFARRGQSVFLLQQPESAIHWSKLHVLPFIETDTQSEKMLLANAKEFARKLDKRITFVEETPITTIQYPITRFRFQAVVFAVTGSISTSRGKYFPRNALTDIAMPAPHRRLINKLLPLPLGQSKS
jgi:A/G-specific adenine glycosylase